MSKKIFIASDHAGYDLKQEFLNLEPILEPNSIPIVEWIDLGPSSTDSVDYPDYAHELCKKVEADENSLGILICGSGQGMAMTANKHKNIRAALCWTTEIAKLSREHNNANVLCLGARAISTELANEILSTFLNTEFEGGRHQRRVDKI